MVFFLSVNDSILNPKNTKTRENPGRPPQIVFPMFQMAGVIVMELTSASQGSSGAAAAAGGQGVYDPMYERLLAVFNCAPYGNDVPFPQSVPQGSKLEVSTWRDAVHLAVRECSGLHNRNT